MTTTDQTNLKEQRLQSEYNRLCAVYGDIVLKLRYFEEQKTLIEKQIDQIGKEKEALDLERAKAANESKTGDQGSPDQTEAA